MPRGAAPGERRGGRSKGTRNKRTIDGEAYARAIVEDETVRAQILSMARDGSLSPELVKTFLAYAFGKPVEVVDVGNGDSPRSVTISF
jgi:uncharacterized protein YbjT (DUF2867 family)